MVTGTADIRYTVSLLRPLVRSGTRYALAFVAVLTLLRLLSAAFLPLSFDESYFWLWTKNLAVSYYDHPPLIALAIRLGTDLFGDTQLGVRFVSLALSIAASWAVWRAAALAFRDETKGALACCLFNATLMVASQSIAAIPDALVLPASAFLLFFAVKLDTTKDGRWWLGIGAALGFALLAKYTALFLGAGVCLWLVASRQGRVWLTSPWPLAALAMAIMAFAPNVIWNANHDWISFKFQFGRVVAGRPTAQYLIEFIGSQLGLASPFILLLAGAGFAAESAKWRNTGPLAIAAAIVWPALAYFAFHAIHSRVQGNWPSFAYPSLVLLAVSVMNSDPRGTGMSIAYRIARTLALPAAVLILAVVYVQAATGFLPWGHRDPLARMTAMGISPVADSISAVAQRENVSAIVTANYVLTGWLAFYLDPRRPVIQVTEDYRWLQAPRAGQEMLSQPLLFVTQQPSNELADVRTHFATVKPLGVFTRSRNGVAIDKFYVFRLAGFHGAALGRLANVTAS
jgi:4-amino-4-deoxy-L-arabinose transferase-like glycosyltransferase